MRCAAPARRCPALGGAVLAVEASTDPARRVQRLAARVKRPWAVTTSPWRPTAEVRPLVVRSGLFIAQTRRFRTSSYGGARAQSLAPLQQPSRSMSGFASPADGRVALSIQPWAVEDFRLLEGQRGVPVVQPESRFQLVHAVDMLRLNAPRRISSGGIRCGRRGTNR